MHKVEDSKTHPLDVPYTLLLSQKQIETRMQELAQKIREDFEGNEILLVCILKGSFIFIADLARLLGPKITIDFMSVSSYGMENASSGNIKIRKDLDIDIHNKHVLVVEDIIDSGLTLQYLMDLLSTRKPATLKVVTLLSKTEARNLNVPVDYVGFDIPNEFVVGYGLDYAEYFRNLPEIVTLHMS